MNSSELKRYDRQMLLPELGIEGQQKLKAASVLVIGAGGLGCPVLLYLSAAGIGHIGVIDHDLVDESNLQRQILYNTSDIGKNKAETAVAKLQLLNPHISFNSFPFKLTVDNAATIIGRYDLVVDGSDNFPTRYLVNDTCVKLGQPLVFGSLFKFEGQVSVFNFMGGPDYRSLYPEPPLAEDVPNCGESGVIGTLPGIVGTYMANETIKLIAGFGETLSGKLMTIDALNNDVRIFNLQKQDKLDRQANMSPVFEGITLDDLKSWRDRHEDFLLIDVREAYEYEESNIGGLNIPLYELADRLTEIPAVQRLVFYCTTGYRSKIAANLVRAKRFKQLFFIKN
ncbi:HesA/MoeB/ThiF family protein [Pedobacter ginsengisoli]|uniref:HesA/MoeB/ThiF family protein n=1 Tax=Pedobacter ginsengisoli TaxID=363852 RepID=UPI00254B31BA|nr:HesA/MoeB/ThiF family protein [Pedobacter ginsengisoli]